MKIYFRVDASLHIGSGHCMRCLVLADEFKKYSCDIVFVMRALNGGLSDYVRNRGYSVCELPKPDISYIPKTTADYAAWLQSPLLEDAEQFLSVVERPDLIVIDHYGISIEWENYVKKRTKCKLIAVDDLVREHNVDLIIDQTVGRKEQAYRSSVGTLKVLAGIKYAMLNPEFGILHPIASGDKRDLEDHKLLLTMGGVDMPNVTLDVLRSLALREKKIETTVLLNKKAPHYHSVAEFCSNNKNWIRHENFCDEMAKLMLEHTISIGAPGSTSWERACMGLPSIVIPIADNQIQICNRLVETGVSLAMRQSDIESQLNVYVDILKQNFDEMRNACLRLCDGNGVVRVAKMIRDLGWI